MGRSRLVTPYLNHNKWTVRLETKKVMVYVCMAQVTEGACQNGVEGVETLQAAEPPCSVSNGPVKINVKTPYLKQLLKTMPALPEKGKKSKF